MLSFRDFPNYLELNLINIVPYCQSNVIYTIFSILKRVFQDLIFQDSASNSLILESCQVTYDNIPNSVNFSLSNDFLICSQLLTAVDQAFHSVLRSVSKSFLLWVLCTPKITSFMLLPVLSFYKTVIVVLHLSQNLYQISFVFTISLH